MFAWIAGFFCIRRNHPSFSDPLRTGYVFAGWQVGDRLVSCADLLKEPDGTAFTSVWEEAPSVLPPAEEGGTESDASASQA